MYFANISTAYIIYGTATVSPKCKTSGTTKQTPKPPQIIAEVNANVEHAFIITILNSTKTFIFLEKSYKHYASKCYRNY